MGGAPTMGHAIWKLATLPEALEAVQHVEPLSVVY
jgi:hypothetical protein